MRPRPSSQATQITKNPPKKSKIPNHLIDQGSSQPSTTPQSRLGIPADAEPPSSFVDLIFSTTYAFQGGLLAAAKVGLNTQARH